MFNVTRFLKRAQSSPQRTSANQRRLDIGLDRRPKVKKSLFAHVLKETAGGVETLHSASERAQHLARHGAHGTRPDALTRWLKQWAVHHGGRTIL